MSDAAEQSLDQAVEEWRELGIRARTEAERPWFWYGESLGDDLAHSVGVVPHDLSGADVDFAVWCSYRYLNAGPGAIAGLYVNERHLGQTPALAGWWGHEKGTQFEMRSEFTPAESAGAWQIGTVPVLSAAPLAGALTSYLVHLLDEQLVDLDCAVGTPRAPERRGGHVAIEHPEAERVILPAVTS